MRRQELAGVCARCQESAEAARAIRAELVGRLTPTVFQPDAAADVGAVLKKPFLPFLNGRWKAARERLRAAYATPPADGQLLADAARLAEYHRLEGHVRATEAEYAADAVRDEAGRVDWRATADRLAEIDRVGQTFGGLPPALQEALAAGRFDRERAVQLAEHLRGVEADLQRAWSAALELVALDAGADDRLPDVALPDLARRARDLLRTAEKEAAATEGLIDLFRPNYDAGLAGAAELLQAAAERARLRSAVARLPLPSTLSQGADEVLSRDWDADRAAATRLLAYLDARPGEVSAAARRALTEPDRHSRLRAAATAAAALEEQGLRESWQFVTTRLFDATAEASTGIVLGQASLAEVARWADERAKDLRRLAEWVRYHEINRDLTQLGLRSLLQDVWRGQVLRV